MSVKWQKEYATGVLEIDRQHQQLFSRLDDLLHAIEQGEGKKAISDIHRFLEEYTRQHFAAEEDLQHRIAYPHVVIHCEEHQSFLKNLEQLKAGIQANGPSDAMIKLTRDSLVNWLIHHICNTDKRLGDYYRAYRNLKGEQWIRSQF